MQSVDERRGDGELHLFIVWEKGGYRRDDILEDIAKDFAIQEVREIEWSAARESIQQKRKIAIELLSVRR